MEFYAILFANIVGWPFIHWAVSTIAFRFPLASFSFDSFLYRERDWEKKGAFYQEYFRVKSWKSKLPDGAALLGHSFTKKKLQSYERSYLETFAKETCRAEWAHWVTLSAAPIFFLWNPPWASLVMFTYAFVANVPCIIAQRYNRLVLQRILRSPEWYRTAWQSGDGTFLRTS